MRSRILFHIYASLLLFNSALSASPIFDQTNANMWLVNEGTGQVSSYIYSADSWTESFLSGIGGSAIYALQSGEQVLVNNLPQSSQLMHAQLAPISIADFGLGQRDAAIDSGVLPLSVSPNAGVYDATVKVEMAVDVTLIDNGPVTLDWSINGNTTGITTGSTSLSFSDVPVDGRVLRSFFLVKDDTYNITITLTYEFGLKTMLKSLVYTLATNDPKGDRRDSDKDGLPDLIEMALGLDPLKSDWLTDSDGNGWSDFDQWLRSDNLDANGVPIDSDNDGWSDFDENLRGTNANDLVKNLITVSADNPAPEPDTQLYTQKLKLFKDVPAATRLYEVEYFSSVSVTELKANTAWQSYTSYSPGAGLIFSSDQLLSDAEAKWSDAGVAAIPERRTLSQLNALVASDTLNSLRLPAGRSQILDIIGEEVETPVAGEVALTRNWHLMYWLDAKPDLSPLNFDAGDTWTTAEQWKTLFINYLGSQLVQNINLQVDRTSTIDVVLLLSVLTKEYELSSAMMGAADDTPIFSQNDGRTARVVEALRQSLILRDNGRTFDDVLIDLQSLSASTKPLESSRDAIEAGLLAMPWEKDYLYYLDELLKTGQASNNDFTNALIDMGRLALFTDGESQLLLDGSLAKRNFVDSDADGLTNQQEILNGVYSTATFPWKKDTDSDLLQDDIDPCPLDSENLCLDTTPTLSVNSNFTVTPTDEGGSVIITVQIDKASDQDVSVNYTLVDGTAVAVEDYIFSSGVLFIPAGELTATLIIDITPSQGVDSVETFDLVLTDNVNANLMQSGYTVSIITVVGGPDITAPTAIINFPPARSITDDTKVIVNGTAADAGGVSSVSVNGVVATSDDGFLTWQANVSLNNGNNTLIVEVTDNSANTNATAAQVEIKRTVYMNPSISALDAANSRIFVYDASVKRQFVEIDLATGLRKVVHVATSIDAISIIGPAGMVFDNTQNRLLLMLDRSDGLVSLDLSTDEISSISAALNARTIGLANDLANNRVISVISTGVDINGDDIYNVIAIDITTGVRTVLSDSLQNTLDYPTDLVMDSRTNRVYIIDGNLDVVVEVDLATGEQSILAQYVPDANYTGYRGVSITLDESTDTLFVIDNFHRMVSAVDIQSGAIKILSTPSIPDSANTLQQPESIVMDAQNKRLLVLDQFINTIWSVDPLTGIRSSFTDANTPDNVNYFKQTTSNIFDSVNQRLFVAHTTYGDLGTHAVNGIYAVDVSSGTRTAVSTDNYPNAVDQFTTNLSNIKLDAINNRLLAVDNDKVISVDIATGIRTVISSYFVPDTNNSYFSAKGLVYDGNNNRVIVATDGNKPLVAVDLTTGVRTIFAAPGITATGDTFDSLAKIIFDRDNNRLLELGFDPYLASVDMTTGDRSVISSFFIPDSTLTFKTLSDFVLDKKRNRVLVYTNLPNVSNPPQYNNITIVAIDLTTGARSIFADNNNYPNDADLLTGARKGLSIDEANDVLFLGGNAPDIMAISLTTGERVSLSR